MKTVRITPKRFEQLGKSNSAQSLAEGSKLKKPVQIGSEYFVSVGGTGSGTSLRAYRVVPRGAYPDEALPYAEHTAHPKHAALRDGELGGYHGMLAKQGKTEFVLVGPPVEFVEGDAGDKSNEIAYAPDMLAVNGPPRTYAFIPPAAYHYLRTIYQASAVNKDFGVPLELEGAKYVPTACVAASDNPHGFAYTCYRLIPAADWKEPVIEGYEITDAMRRNPNGIHHGQVVRCNMERFVLCGPPRFFVEGRAHYEPVPLLDEDAINLMFGGGLAGPLAIAFVEKDGVENTPVVLAEFNKKKLSPEQQAVCVNALREFTGLQWNKTDKPYVFEAAFDSLSEKLSELNHPWYAEQKSRSEAEDAKAQNERRKEAEHRALREANKKAKAENARTTKPAKPEPKTETEPANCPKCGHPSTDHVTAGKPQRRICMTFGCEPCR